jgi:predicted lipoprotein with Yx(FWY)xxD motif
MSAHARNITRSLSGAAAALAAALLLAACGGGTGSYGSTGSGSTAPSTHTKAASSGAITTGKTSAGTVLVDPRGQTLYAFAADSPGTSNCAGSCASYWPPEPAPDSLTPAAGVTAKLSSIKRSDGSRQLTVNGWPAYTYAGDSGPGQATGQGEDLSGGRWWVLAPSGSQIKTGADQDDAGY